MNRTAVPAARSVRTTSKSRSTSVAEQCGRRLVHHDDPRARARWPCRSRRSAGPRLDRPRAIRAGSSATPSRREIAAASACIAGAVDAPASTRGCAPHEDVLGDGQVGEEGRLLVDDRDPGRVRRRAGRCRVTSRSTQQQPGIRLVHAREDLHQRRLAGAVLADQGVRLPGIQLDRSVEQAPARRRRLRRVLQHQDGLGTPGGQEHWRARRPGRPGLPPTASRPRLDPARSGPRGRSGCTLWNVSSGSESIAVSMGVNDPLLLAAESLSGLRRLRWNAEGEVSQHARG